MKDPCQQERKKKDLGSAPQCISDTQARKQKRPQYMKPREANYSASTAHNPEAPGVADSPKKKQKQQANKDKDLSNITNYNCDKKGHYASKYLEPPKNRSKN